MKVSKYAKAIVGALVAAGSAAVPALSDNVLTSAELVTIVVAGLTGLGVVWAVPNKADGAAQ